MHIPRLIPVGLGLAVLVAIGLIAMNWPPRWGSDLAGGVQLIYPLAASDSSESDARRDGPIDWPALVQAVQQRASFAGTQDVVVRQSGEREIEIISPACDDVDRERIEYIKRMVSVAGHLEFRIVANRRDHADIIAAAESLAQTTDGAVRRQRSVGRDVDATNAGNRQPVGYWALVGKSTIRAGELGEFVLRNPATGELVDLQTLTPVRDNNQTVAEFLADNQLDDIEMLVVTNDGCNVTNRDFSRVKSQFDKNLQHCVTFRMTRSGAERFAALTSANLPELKESPPFYRHLGIILDGQLLSFPRLRTQIYDRGSITGTFTREEAEALTAILRARPLPVRLAKTPRTEQPIRPDTTAWRAAFSIVAVVLFVHVSLWVIMFTGHGQIGQCGCGASILQVCLSIAGFVAVRSPLTLPGIAAGSVVSLLNVMGVYWICARAFQLAPQAIDSPPAFWRGLMFPFVSCAAMLAVMAWGGIAAYVTGSQRVVSTGMVVALGSAAALGTLMFGIFLPLLSAVSPRGVGSKPVPN